MARLIAHHISACHEYLPLTYLLDLIYYFASAINNFVHGVIDILMEILSLSNCTCFLVRFFLTFCLIFSVFTVLLSYPFIFRTSRFHSCMFMYWFLYVNGFGTMTRKASQNHKIAVITTCTVLLLGFISALLNFAGATDRATRGLSLSFAYLLIYSIALLLLLVTSRLSTCLEERVCVSFCFQIKQYD